MNTEFFKLGTKKSVSPLSNISNYFGFDTPQISLL